MRSPRDGNLVLGGYDSASITGSWHDYPMNYSDTLAGRHCPLQVHIQGLQLLLEGQKSVQLLGDGDGHLACIEPYDNLFRLSELGLAGFTDVTGWSPNINYAPNDLFLPEPGLMYPSTASFNGSLKFVFDDGFTVIIPNSELQRPLRGLDKQGSVALHPNITEVNVYNDSFAAWVLERVFLSQVYLAVDYDAQVIKLADVRQNPVTPSPVRFSSANEAKPATRDPYE
ncbi:hypothetical protein CC86DRAFT_404991 [Ophiobolus disseminans]|uniref:Peptidase A1 domain-containing protein n=1 Tax=Ophiobolus disseminans TaxID=1469910 RepID=A0A6A7A5E6_9PLEO|nr:hypothetical protein CC86DRAFT_404991 [Ophiobolus disseminans]